MKLLDTNILVKIFAETSDFNDFPKIDAISRVSYLEFLSWEQLENDEVELFKEILVKKFHIIELDEDTADLAAEIRRKHKITLGDAIILTTAISLDIDLESEDRRLMKKYEKLKIMYKNTYKLRCYNFL